jgi:thymidylate synthase (FAD)
MTSETPVPITFRSDMTVQLLKHAASDLDVVKAAKVSTLGSAAKDIDGMSEAGLTKFIDFLMSGRHGSPFEHNNLTFYVQAPIFVFREFMRHRIASYNEESGRYTTMRPVFYVPAPDRMLVQVGKAGEYRFVPGTDVQTQLVDEVHRDVATQAYAGYQRLLDAGVAREVARISLPLNLYSSTWVTMNARSLMNFLSLRVKAEDSMFPSFPQREIEMVAEVLEEAFAEAMPVTHAAFVARGRVAP